MDRKVKKEEKVKAKKIKKELKSLSKDRENLIELREKRYIFEASIFVVIAIVLLVLLCNRTFFKDQYKSKNARFDVPIFSFFISDKDNVVTFKTLRKSEKVKQYFDEYLDKLDFYSCNDQVFYYDKYNKVVLYSAEVEKWFAIKTVKIKYRNNTPEQICETK